MERFNATVLDEFFRVAFRETLYESVEPLQSDLDGWPVCCNQERQNYRNLGRRPYDTITLYLEVMRQEP